MRETRINLNDFYILLLLPTPFLTTKSPKCPKKTEKCSTFIGSLNCPIELVIYYDEVHIHGFLLWSDLFHEHFIALME